MPRAIWSGTISFGLVNVPVKLFSATESKGVRFHQFQAGTGRRIRYQRVAEGSGEEVAYEDIVKGYDVGDGRYVMVTPEELEAVEPGGSRSIEIQDFVDLDEVDAIYFQKTYHVVPADETAAKPFALLRAAMEDANRAGVATFVMRTKQYLAAIRPTAQILLLETMFFADEVRHPGAIDETRVLDDDIRLGERERAVAAQLIDSLTREWDPTRYRDTYRERVLDLIERKAEGEVVVTERPPEPGRVVDLMAALEASVEAARRGGSGRRGNGGGGAEAAGYERMSKSDLYQEAQRREISGRSKMSRDELIDALRRAS